MNEIIYRGMRDLLKPLMTKVMRFPSKISDGIQASSMQDCSHEI